MNRLLSGAALVLLAGAISGCAGVAGSISITTPGGKVLAVGADTGAGSDAAVEGTLALSDERCWGITTTDGTFVVIVWPAGTSGDGETLTVAGRELSVGDSLTIGGGETSSDDARDLSDQCGGDDVFAASSIN